MLTEISSMEEIFKKEKEGLRKIVTEITGPKKIVVELK